MQVNKQVGYCELKERTVVNMWLKCWESERLLRTERKNCCERLWHWVVFRCTAIAISDRTEENCHSPRLTGTGTTPSEGLRGLPTKLRSGSCGELELRSGSCGELGSALQKKPIYDKPKDYKKPNSIPL